MTSTQKENKPQSTINKVGGENMEQVIESATPGRNKAMIKAFIFVAFVIIAIYIIKFTPVKVAFVIIAIYIIKFTPVKGYLTAEALGSFLNTAGLWAPLAFVFVYAAGVCLFVPGTLLTGIGAAIYVWLGAMVGASAAFWIGRTLGREFAASLIGDKLKKYDDSIERNGFAATLYLRLLYFPFTPMNFGMGLHTHEFRYGPYQGTFLGLLFWYRSGHHRRDLYLHLFHRYAERCLGLSKLG